MTNKVSEIEALLSFFSFFFFFISIFLFAFFLSFSFPLRLNLHKSSFMDADPAVFALKVLQNKKKILP